MNQYVAITGLVLLLLAWVGGCAHGESAEHDRRVAEVATLHQTYADAAREAAQDSVARLQAAHLRGDQVTRQLLSTEAALAASQTERDREIKRLTTGRVCLSADAVRVLNARAEGGGSTASVPSPASVSAAADAAGAATDTDIGLWASDARARYSQCAERLSALIDWFQPQTQGAAR